VPSRHFLELKAVGITTLRELDRTFKRIQGDSQMWLVIREVKAVNEGRLFDDLNFYVRVEILAGGQHALERIAGLFEADKWRKISFVSKIREQDMSS